MLHDIAAPAPMRFGPPGLAAALEDAAGAIARLDQALAGHPLQAAFLYRARLEAVRRHAAADGSAIDPWHLAAVLEGLRLRMDHALHVVDRGAIFDAARTAFGLHQWITAPDFDQEEAVQAAECHLSAGPAPGTLLGTAIQVRSWLSAGGARPPIRAALIRHWMRRGLLGAALPLTGARALSLDEVDGEGEGAVAWDVRFLAALAAEARDFFQLLRDLEHGWLAARARSGGRRRTCRAASAIDALAAAPLLSATSLAGILGMSVKGATGLLDGFAAAGIVVEVTHRAKRRLFGLSGLAPLRDGTAAPRRPEPGRGPGRPRRPATVPPPDQPSVPNLPPLRRHQWPRIDYAALDAAVADCEQAIRATRQALNRLTDPRPLGTIGPREPSPPLPLSRRHCL